MFSLMLAGGTAPCMRASDPRHGAAGSERRLVRSAQTRSYSRDAVDRTRIPISDHLSLAFSLGGTYNRTYTPPLPLGAGNGFLTRLTRRSMSRRRSAVLFF